MGLEGERLTEPIDMMMPLALEEVEKEEFRPRDTILSSGGFRVVPAEHAGGHISVNCDPMRPRIKIRGEF